MKKQTSLGMASACFAAVAMLAVGAATTQGATPAPITLTPQLAVRPLTPGDIKAYGLTGQQGASGLSTVGVGQPAYLEALANISFPSSNIVSVSWALTNKAGIADLLPSPLGTNVPTYKMADRLTVQVIGRTMLRPDMAGQYTVVATITTTTGVTNLVQNITAGTYIGAQVCELCHSGSAVASSTYPGWSKTAHATFFTKAIDGLESDHYGKNCISCHTVGYDVNTNAVNGGFDDVAKNIGWVFPAVLTNGNWAALPQALKNLGNIQCENCHGPGSEHAQAFGNTNLLNWPRITTSFSAGDCGQCHDSPSQHIKNVEWNNSRHAIAVAEGETGCAGCHQGIAYVDRMAGVVEAQRRTAYEAITCSTCHDPHDATNPHILRTGASVKLMDNKTTVTNGGNGTVCMNCHISRRDATNYVEITAGSTRFGPHHGPQTDMLVGANAVTYGKSIPSSAHRDAVADSCAACHMQAVASTNSAFLHAGGHTFSMAWEGDATHAPTDLVGACVQCHGPMTSFDIVRADYDGNGVVEGVQTEVKGLLNKLSFMLPPVGVAKTNISTTVLGINSSWNKQQLKAGYNYLFVVEDGSFGVHNLAYTVGILKASIADLTGDGNNDGLSDAWQVKYFGSATSPNAAPNASPAGDGIPNWLKFTLGLDPMVKGIQVPDGVVWANGSTLINPSGTNNVVKIFTAAEVAFNTVVGKTYQIQAVSTLGGGWQNIGTPIPGTGNTISYVTPTRANAQQFYRVVVQ